MRQERRHSSHRLHEGSTRRCKRLWRENRLKRAPSGHTFRHQKRASLRSKARMVMNMSETTDKEIRNGGFRRAKILDATDVAER